MKILNPEFIFDLLKGQKPRVLLQGLEKNLKSSITISGPDGALPLRISN